MGCRTCGGGSRPRGSAVGTTRDGDADRSARGPVRFRVIPPVGDPVDGLATMQEAEAVQAEIGGEIKRVIG